MKKLFLLFLFFTITSLNAQINLLSITPSNGTTNVPLSTNISIQFDSPIDTLRGFDFFKDYFTNAFDVQTKWYSSDLKTVNLGVNLEADKNYYFLVYSAFNQSSEALANPTVVYFTTASELTGNTVTGTVYASESSGLDLSNTLIALSSTSIENGEPKIEMGAFANKYGAYSIPNVNDGDYYPIAANDANGDGELDPSKGDAFAFLDKITINSDYSGLDFSLSIMDPLTLSAAYEFADSVKQELLPGNATLKRISSGNTDSLGNAGEWEFYFLTDSLNKVSRLRIDRFGYKLENQYDVWEYQSLKNMEQLPSLDNSVNLSVFAQNAEAAGGYEFRNQTKPSNLQFNLEIMLADQRYSHLAYLNPDTSQHIMWAACYRWYEQVNDSNWQTESELVFFGNYQTGDLVITDVKNIRDEVSDQYYLSQNYPNPFNPTTVISYSVPSKKYVNISVFDILGNKITTLVNEAKQAGNYEIKFDANPYPSGTYFYQIKTEDYTNTKKMLLLK
jgi:hypothetical protein